MSRNLLHVSMLGDFKSWLDSKDIQHRPGRGDFELLQVQVKPPSWYCVFSRLENKEHYTVDWRMEGLVRKFIKDRRIARGET